MAAQCARSALRTSVSMPTAMASDFAPAMATCDCENYMAAREPSRPSCFCSGGVMLHILLVISLTLAIASAAIAVIITQEITELKEIHRTYQTQRDQELLETVGYGGPNSGPMAQPLMAPPPMSGNSNEFCVPCGELSAVADDASMVTTHFELTGEGNQVQRVCCVNRFNATQLGALMKSFFMHSLSTELYSSGEGSGSGRLNTSGNPSAFRAYKEHASAHLLGAPQTETTSPGTNGAHKITSWISDGDVTHRRHVTYSNGCLVVPSDGLYYVYTQVHFVEYQLFSERHGGDSQRVSHFLFRFNPFYPSVGEERLLQSSESKSWARDVFEHTSYLGATFHLRAGDEIYVAVSDPTLLHGDFKSSYFGVVQIK